MCEFCVRIVRRFRETCGSKMRATSYATYRLPPKCYQFHYSRMLFASPHPPSLPQRSHTYRCWANQMRCTLAVHISNASAMELNNNKFVWDSVFALCSRSLTANANRSLIDHFEKCWNHFVAIMINLPNLSTHTHKREISHRQQTVTNSIINWLDSGSGSSTRRMCTRLIYH